MPASSVATTDSEVPHQKREKTPGADKREVDRRVASRPSTRL